MELSICHFIRIGGLYIKSITQTSCEFYEWNHKNFWQPLVLDAMQITNFHDFDPLQSYFLLKHASNFLMIICSDTLYLRTSSWNWGKYNLFSSFIASFICFTSFVFIFVSLTFVPCQVLSRVFFELFFV